MTCRCVLAVAVAVVAVQPAAAQNPPKKKPEKPAVGILVPLYLYPGQQHDAADPAAPPGPGVRYWGEVVRVARKYPNVEFRVVMNDSNGEFATLSPDYAAVLKAPPPRNLKYLFYVHLVDGKTQKLRDLKDVAANIDAWGRAAGAAAYGFFLDESPAAAKDAAFAADVAAHIRRAHPKAVIFANPGAVCDPAYIEKRTADVYLTCENFADKYPGAGAFAGLLAAREKAPVGQRPEFAAVLHGFKPAKDDTVAARVAALRQDGFRWVYLTDYREHPKQYSGLPSYLDELAKAAK
jgi:hypothetical protein